MKTNILLIFLFIGLTSQAQNNKIELKIYSEITSKKSIEKVVLPNFYHTKKALNNDELVRVHRNKNKRILKALDFKVKSKTSKLV